MAEVYEDNDTSAFGRKPRPAYLRMLEDVKARRGSRSGCRKGGLRS